MPFQTGHKLATGRPKGAPNKRTVEYRDILQKHGFCPVTAMLEVFQEAKRQYEKHGLSENQERADIAHRYLKICGDMASEITSYSYPKKRAIEATIDQSLVDAIKALEGKSEQELLAILEAKPA